MRRRRRRPEPLRQPLQTHAPLEGVHGSGDRGGRSGGRGWGHPAALAATCENESAASKRLPPRAARARNDAAPAPWTARGCGARRAAAAAVSRDRGPGFALRAALPPLGPQPPARPRLRLPIRGRFLRLRTAPAEPVLKRQRAPPGSSSPCARGGGWGGPGWEGAGREGGREGGKEQRARERGRNPAPSRPRRRALSAARPPSLPPGLTRALPLRSHLPAASPLPRPRRASPSFPPVTHRVLPRPHKRNASGLQAPRGSCPPQAPNDLFRSKSTPVWAASKSRVPGENSPGRVNVHRTGSHRPVAGEPAPGRGQSPGLVPAAPSRVLVQGPPAPPFPASSPGTRARLSDSSPRSNGPPDAAS